MGEVPFDPLRKRVLHQKRQEEIINPRHPPNPALFRKHERSRVRRARDAHDDFRIVPAEEVLFPLRDELRSFVELALKEPDVSPVHR